MYKWANSCTIALLITIRKAVQEHLGGIVIKCVVLMYNICTCLYNVCTRLYNVCTCTTHVQRMYMSIHCMYMYVHGFTVHNFNQLSQQVLVAITEMQMSLSPPMQGTTRMGAVPVWKMVIFFMPGQMLQKQRRPSASLSVAWTSRSKLVLTDCIHG